MNTKSQPDYKAIFSDILDKKFPEKREQCMQILNKKNLKSFDIIKLNNIIFESVGQETENVNQKYRSYNESDIRFILDYQKQNNLNNVQLANHFKLSRNSISKWKKIYIS